MISETEKYEVNNETDRTTMCFLWKFTLKLNLDIDIDISKLIHLISNMNEIDTMTILKRTYVRYYGNAGDKSYGKKYINMWNSKMRL